MVEDSPRPRKRQRIEWTDTFEVKVGTAPDDKIYTLHRDLFIQRSPFLRAAISLPWKKGAAPVDLTDHDAATFDSYLDRVYLNGPPYPHMGNGAGDISSDEKAAMLKSMLALYILADELGDLKTANQVIDELIQLSDSMNQVPGYKATNDAFDATPDASPLRRLLVDWYVHDATADVLTYSKFSPDLLAAAFVEFARLRKLIADKGTHARDDGLGVAVSGMVEKDKCRYHQHNSDVPKCP